MAHIIELQATHRTTAEELAIKLAHMEETVLEDFIVTFLSNCSHGVRMRFLARFKEMEYPIRLQLVKEWDEGDVLVTVNVRGALASKIQEACAQYGSSAKIRIVDPLT